MSPSDEAASILDDQPHEGGQAVSTAPHQQTQRDETQQATGAEQLAGNGPLQPNAHDTEQAQAFEQMNTHETEERPGNVTPASPSVPPAGDELLARARASGVTNRLLREGRWKGQAETTRNDMMATCKRQGMTQDQAQEWVYAELDRMYPPVQSADQGIRTYGDKCYTGNTFPDAGQDGKSAATDSGTIQGLSDIPSDWPELPANASLASEIGWVQANRLRIVEERPGRATVVRLERAAGPAPSLAALGWLETSIRSYAKYVDVAARASGGADDEASVMRHERRSIDQVRALLDEMLPEGDTCPACGQAIR